MTKVGHVFPPLPPLQAYYRHEVLNKYVDWLDKNPSEVMPHDLMGERDALTFLRRAVKNMKPDAIANCWRRCKILPLTVQADISNDVPSRRSNIAPEVKEVEKLLFDDLTVLFAKWNMKTGGPSKDEQMKVAEYLDIPEEEEEEDPDGEEAMTDAIVRAVVSEEAGSDMDDSEGEGEDEGVGEGGKAPTLVEALEGVQSVLRYIEEHGASMAGVGENVLDDLLQIQSKLRGMRIADHFRRTDKQTDVRQFFRPQPQVTQYMIPM